MIVKKYFLRNWLSWIKHKLNSIKLTSINSFNIQILHGTKTFYILRNYLLTEIVLNRITLLIFRRNNATKFEALNRRCEKPSNQEVNLSQQPLQEELEAVNELINCIQADLAQTVFLITYIKNYVSKNCKRIIPL